MSKLSFTIIATLFSFSFSSKAEISTIRIAEIKAIAYSVEFTSIQKIFKKIEFDSSFPGPAASRKMDDAVNYELVINPIIMKSFPESVRTLILYHEMGHYYLGHLDQPYLDDIEFRSSIEFEADAFSAFLYRKNAQPLDDLKNFIKSMESQTDTVPSGSERAKIFENILFKKE